MNSVTHGPAHEPVYEVVSPSGYRCAIFTGADAETRAWQYVLHNAPRATSGEYSRVIKRESYTAPIFSAPRDIPNFEHDLWKPDEWKDL